MTLLGEFSKKKKIVTIAVEMKFSSCECRTYRKISADDVEEIRYYQFRK